MAGEVTTLEHELGDDTVEDRATVALALRQLAELTEVLGRLGDIRLVEVEVDAASFGWRGSQSSMPMKTTAMMMINWSQMAQ